MMAREETLKKTNRRKRTTAVILLVIMLACLFLLIDCANNMRLASSGGSKSVPLSPARPQNTEMTVAVIPDMPPPSGKERALLVASSAPDNVEGALVDKRLRRNALLKTVPTRTAKKTVNTQLATNDDLVQETGINLTHDPKVNATSNKAQPVSSPEMRKAKAVNTPTQTLEFKPAVSATKGVEPLGRTFKDSVTGMEFLLVKGGCFQMGSNDGRVYEKPMHEVCLEDFYLGKYEVTQREWKALMGRSLSSFNGNRRPIERVTWDDAQSFILKLNDRSGMTYRLPTEAEWEYAARSGGRQEKYAGTSSRSSLVSFAWHDVNSGGQTRAVGLKKPNSIGLHDMSGNVWEWCSDWYSEDYYAQSERDNPQGPATGRYRVIRGGEWSLPGRLTRTTYRDASKPDIRKNDIGFRLVLTMQ